MSSPDNPTAIGLWVRRRREERGLSRHALARMARVPQRALEHLETGLFEVNAPATYRIRRALLLLNPALAATAPLLEEAESPPHLAAMLEGDLTLPSPPAHAQLTLFRAQGRLGISINLDVSAIAALVDRSRQSLEGGLSDGELLTLDLAIVEHKT